MATVTRDPQTVPNFLIDTSPDTRDVYDQLEALALPLIENYKADLTEHDRRWLEDPDNDRVPFLHFTNLSGTHIIPLPPADHTSWPLAGERVPYLFGTADRDHILRQAEALRLGIETSGRPQQLRLHYDGRQLREITADQAARIVQGYTRRTRDAWRAR